MCRTTEILYIGTMNKIIFILLMLTALQTTKAQDFPLTESGTYEYKKLVMIDSLSADEFYTRAIQALSIWKGPNGLDSGGIDVNDRKTGTIIYNGLMSVGFEETMFGEGWNRWVEFRIKIRCKGGCAQITSTLTQLVGQYSRRAVIRTYSMQELKNMVGSLRRNKHEQGVEFIRKIVREAKTMARDIAEMLLEAPEEDDF